VPRVATPGAAQRAGSQRAITVQDLMDAAAEIFAAKGVRASNLEELAAEFGVTKPALYYYLRSKQQLLWMIFQHILDIYTQQATAIVAEPTDVRAKLRTLVVAHAGAVIEHRAYTTIFFREQAQLSTHERRQLRAQIREYERVFERLYEEGVRSGIFRDLDVHAVVGGILGMCNWLYQWYDPRGRVKPQEITRLYADVLERGYLLHA
jgi:TetR/AcrR family transcriptional regulator, cholesterol catabolism regulator